MLIHTSVVLECLDKHLYACAMSIYFRLGFSLLLCSSYSSCHLLCGRFISNLKLNCKHLSGTLCGRCLILHLHSAYTFDPIKLRGFFSRLTLCLLSHFARESRNVLLNLFHVCRFGRNSQRCDVMKMLFAFSRNWLTF